MDENETKNWRTGIGSCRAHHGELFQGQVADERGRLRRCLMTLPCENFRSTVSFIPDPGCPVTVQPANKEKARRTVELVLAAVGRMGIGGLIQVSSNIEECKGYGSSTADCVAAAIAVADALRIKLHEEEIARLVVQAEQASDNVMFSNASLFAHREGVVLEHYMRPVPQMEILGVDTQPDEGIDTLKYTPASYTWKEVQHFEILASALRRAIQTQDRHLLGRVATASADINERFLPKPGYKEIRALSERVGALGVAVAHSGTVLSVMLDPFSEATMHKLETLSRNIRALGLSKILHLNTHARHLQREIA
jgi:uncharacterized protein involved in propanediol utilization